LTLRALIAAGAVLLGGCQALPRQTLLQGETMGSAWTVKIAGDLPAPAAQLQAGVQARFEAVDQALSTYRPSSALSGFNGSDSGDWVPIDPELSTVLAYALELAQRSDGAYDVTVGPLVDLWGFGPRPATNRVPDGAAIAAARARVGWRKVEVDATFSRARKAPGVRVDLSSLGKGRGVDRAAEYLEAAGVTNYLIDLSGKLRARGHNPAGNPWRVAIEVPGPDNRPDNLNGSLPATIELHDEGVATAGDYRRYFEIDGRHYSHIIDPRTGHPVIHATVSATALGATCMEADALATVFMVMPPAAAIRLADEMRVRALLVGGAGRAELTPSAAWRAD
jgi:thiamine biosynthesis lipoprotein